MWTILCPGPASPPHTAERRGCPRAQAVLRCFYWANLPTVLQPTRPCPQAMSSRVEHMLLPPGLHSGPSLWRPRARSHCQLRALVRAEPPQRCPGPLAQCALASILPCTLQMSFLPQVVSLLWSRLCHWAPVRPPWFCVGTARHGVGWMHLSRVPKMLVPGARGTGSCPPPFWVVSGDLCLKCPPCPRVRPLANACTLSVGTPDLCPPGRAWRVLTLYLGYVPTLRCVLSSQSVSIH